MLFQALGDPDDLSTHIMGDFFFYSHRWQSVNVSRCNMSHNDLKQDKTLI